MSLLAHAFERGQWDAFRRFKIAAPAPVSHPTVKESPLLRSRSADPPPQAAQQLQAPTHPDTIKQVFDATEQSKTRIEPNKKLAEDLCTTCRKTKHYGPCLKPSRTRSHGTPLKAAGFNLGMRGDDPNFATSGPDGPSTSANYHSATSDSSLARARDGRPADEQAATGFADLFRHLGIIAPADQAVNNTDGLNKTALAPSTAIHSSSENRGPTTNIYEQLRVPGKAPIVGWGDEADQRIDRAFNQVDNAPDSTNIEGNWGGPESGPAVLG